jgi:hypothetical protein
MTWLRGIQKHNRQLCLLWVDPSPLGQPHGFGSLEHISARANSNHLTAVNLTMKISFSGKCGPRVDSLAGWRTGAKIKFPV